MSIGSNRFTFFYGNKDTYGQAINFNDSQDNRTGPGVEGLGGAFFPIGNVTPNPNGTIDFAGQTINYDEFKQVITNTPVGQGNKTVTVHTTDGKPVKLYIDKARNDGYGFVHIDFSDHKGNALNVTTVPTPPPVTPTLPPVTPPPLRITTMELDETKTTNVPNTPGRVFVPWQQTPIKPDTARVAPTVIPTAPPANPVPTINPGQIAVPETF
jgi:hypothetical protein